MAVSKLNYQGVEILCVDYSACKSKEDMLRVLGESFPFFEKAEPQSMRVLINMKNAFGSTDFMMAAKRARKEVYQNKVKKSAILGIEGIKKVLLTAYNKIGSNTAVPFNTEGDALRYLSS